MSDECYFDEELYRQTGHGGHCTNCMDNRGGIHCEQCLSNHYIDSTTSRCTACYCDETGKLAYCREQEFTKVRTLFLQRIWNRSLMQVLLRWKVDRSRWKVYRSSWKVVGSIWKVYRSRWKVVGSSWKVYRSSWKVDRSS